MATVRKKKVKRHAVGRGLFTSGRTKDQAVVQSNMKKRRRCVGGDGLHNDGSGQTEAVHSSVCTSSDAFASRKAKRNAKHKPGNSNQQRDGAEPSRPSNANQQHEVEPARKKQKRHKHAVDLSCFCLQGGRPSSEDLWDMRQLPRSGEQALYNMVQRATSKLKKTIGSPVREAALLDAVGSLAKKFEETCATVLGGRKWFSHFEQWLWSRRGVSDLCKSGAGVVPVLPTGPNAARDPELGRKLCRAGCSMSEARRTCEVLAARSEELSRDIEHTRDGPTHIAVEHVDGKEGPMMKMTCNMGVVECTPIHYEKLRMLYARYASRERAGDASEMQKSSPSRKERSSDRSEAFNAAAFCTLARLAALQGANPRAGGMQAAIHGEVFDALHEDFGCAAECFASPLNCRWGRYCSAAPDVDRPFGSLGTFLEFQPTYGSFEANPPFDVGVVAAMAAHMETLLAAADCDRSPLCFVVVIPRWHEEACWQAIRASKFRKAEVTLKQDSHGYCEGGQHYRSRRYRQANHDSSVFILQTEAAAQQWPATPGKLQRLRAAFRPKQER